MADPPNGARADASPRASARASRSNTTGYQQRVHGRGRPTAAVACAQDPGWTDTSARVCSWRIGVSCRANAGHDCRRGRANRSGGITHRTFGGSLRHPAGCPSSRRTGKRKPVAVSSGGCVGECTQREPGRSSDATAPVESCRAWRRERSRPQFRGRHLEARGYALRRGVAPRHSEVRRGSSKPTKFSI